MLIHFILFVLIDHIHFIFAMNMYSFVKAGPFIGNIIAIVLVAIILFLCNLVRTLIASSGKKYEIIELNINGRRDVFMSLLPAFCGLLIFFVLLAAFKASNYYNSEDIKDSLNFLVNFSFADSPGAEMVARGIWATSLGAVILSAFVVCWVAVDIWIKFDHQKITQSLNWFLICACILIFSTLLSAWLRQFPDQNLPNFGSVVSVKMLDAIWSRLCSVWLSPITDGLNAVALLLCILIAGNFCLLLSGILHAQNTLEAAAKTNRYRFIEIDIIFKAATNAKIIRSHMDQMLYAGAFALMAGLFEVIATLHWSYAPFDDATTTKLRADLCKALPVNAASSAMVSFSESLKLATCVAASASNPAIQCAMEQASAASAATTASTEMGKLPATCQDLPKNIKIAVGVDDLKQFTRSLALIFGASFSALLASMYLPLALIFEAHMEGLKTLMPESLDKPDIEIQHGAVKYLVNLLATLGPLVVGLLSAVFSL